MKKKLSEYTIEGLPKLLELPERYHIITKDDVDKIDTKFNELGCDAKSFGPIIGLTLMEASCFAISIETLGIAKMFGIYLNALWPERFELLLNE